MYLHPKIKCIDLRIVQDLVNKKIFTEEFCQTLPIVNMILFKTDKIKCFQLPDAGDTNPYHLFIYMLSRFAFLDNNQQQIPYYYPKKDSYLVETALSLLPLHFVRFTEKDSNVEYIDLPSCTWYNDCIEEDWIYSYLRDLYKPIWENVVGDRKRIFISRKAASLRKLQQEADLVDPLKERGFSFYELEGMTFEDQIKLFRSASIVIGVHGAGLVWTLFSCEGTKVCEIPFQGRNHYKAIAEKNKLQYFTYDFCGYSENETIVLEKQHFLEFVDTNLL